MSNHISTAPGNDFPIATQKLQANVLQVSLSYRRLQKGFAHRTSNFLLELLELVYVNGLVLRQTRRVESKVAVAPQGQLTWNASQPVIFERAKKFCSNTSQTPVSNCWK